MQDDDGLMLLLGSILLAIFLIALNVATPDVITQAEASDQDALEVQRFESFLMASTESNDLVESLAWWSHEARQPYRLEVDRSACGEGELEVYFQVAAAAKRWIVADVSCTVS